jgi:DNA-binding transcriptional MocR family regulator
MNVTPLDRAKCHKMTRPRSTFEFAIPPRLSEQGRGRWLREILRSAIQSGALRLSQSLPSTRELTKSLGLARGTIVSAIDHLKEEGYLKSIPGSGIFVADTLPEAFLSSRSVPTQAHPGKSRPIALSEFAERLAPVSCEAAHDRIPRQRSGSRSVSDRSVGNGDH